MQSVSAQKNIARIAIWCLLLGASIANGRELVFSGIEGSVNSDISVRVLREAYGQLGFTVKYIPLPGERSLRTANNGDVDGEVFRVANVEKKYLNLIVVPTPINTLSGIAFSKRHLPIAGWRSLEPYRIGIQVGIKFAERGTDAMNPTIVDTNEQLFQMLQADRIDVAVAAYTNGVATIAELGLSGIIALDPPIAEYPLYHYLHKKNAELIPALDAVLLRMEASGRTREIRAGALRELSAPPQ